MQVKTPSGGPWWKSGNVYDNARVRFQVSGTTTFLGFITSIDAELAENGLGTRASVKAAAASNFLDKIIVYKGKVAAAGYSLEYTANFGVGTASSTDQANVTALVAKADAVQAYTSGTSGRTANRLIVATNTTPAYTGTAVTVGNIKFVPGSLRSCLDSIKEAAESVDGEQRRYWVAPSGRIQWARLGATMPTYANAPFKIVTTGTFDPVGSVSTPSTLQARSLSVSLDHDAIIKKARFVMSEAWSKLDSQISGGSYTVSDPYGRVYDAASPNGAGMSTRNGPRPEGIIQVNPVPAKQSSPTFWTTRITNYSKRYFGTDTYPNRAAPLRSITLTIAGAGASPNQYGYASGYRQTAPSTFVLQSGWEAGQYLNIEASALDLSGLYRIETISMGFEPGSMVRKFDLTCERVPRNPLKKFLESA